MKINLFGYTLTIVLTKNDIIGDVERLAKTYTAYDAGATKLARIKAYRVLTNAGLKDAKEWVEAHFVA